MKAVLPVGKLPPELLAKVLSRAPLSDPRVLLGPGLGLDCAVIDMGQNLLVVKTDPITFATAEIGWYAVQVSANDIATTAAVPRWFLATLLLPEGVTTSDQVLEIGEQTFQACRELDISVVGGHTEITYGLDRPILVGTMIGEVARQELVTPLGAAPGDRLLLTKGVPLEATALLARQFPERLSNILSPAELLEAAAFLYKPGISVVRDARLACQAGHVSAMHDPTEGGLACALWELAEACQHSLQFEPSAVVVPELSRRICASFEIDPLASIASGALLLAAPYPDSDNICQALLSQGIPCSEIGRVTDGPPLVYQNTPAGQQIFQRPQRDDIARIFSE
jgi:hydrogenase expression/formation protein HypE